MASTPQFLNRLLVHVIILACGILRGESPNGVRSGVSLIVSLGLIVFGQYSLLLHRGELLESLEDNGYSGLTHGVREQMSGQRVDKLCRTQYHVDLGANVRTEFSRFCPNFGNEGGAAIDYGDEIFQIAAAEEILLSATFERLKLRCDKKWGGDHPDLKIIY